MAMNCKGCGNDYVDNYCPKCIQIIDYINNISFCYVKSDYLVTDWIPYKIENERAFKNIKVEGLKINVNDIIKKFRLERLIILLGLFIQSDISNVIWVKVNELNIC